MTMHAIDPDGRERALQRYRARKRREARRLVGLALLCWGAILVAGGAFWLLVWAVSEVRL